MRGKICAFLCAMAVICTSIGSLIPVMDVQAEEKREDEQGFVWQGTTIVGYKGTATEITIPKGATEIGYLAFSGNEKLTTVVIPEGVKNIEGSAFAFNRNLVQVVIPDGVTKIGRYAFGGCKKLSNINIPNSVTSIESLAFIYCESLTKIEIPKDIKKISSGVFDGCNNLTEITIPDGVTSIGDEAFRSCESLTDIIIPSSITSIGNFAFSYCTYLETIDLPESVTNIGYGTFSGCKGLKALIIPKSVINIGDEAFTRCENLETIQVEEGNPAYDSRGRCNAIIDSKNDILISGCKNTEIPNDVISIGKEAFSGCYITDVNIPGNVTQIGERAFESCSNLTNVTISKGVENIGKAAFGGCVSLKEIWIPNSVTFIGWRAFAACNKMERIRVEESNPIYDSREDCNAIIETAGDVLISGCKNTEIPDGVKSIGKNAFQRCEGLTSIVIPKSVMSIDDNAFWGCEGLTSIVIPNSVASIGDDVFRYCNGELIIYCEYGSLAQNYAESKGLTFEIHHLDYIEKKLATCGEAGNIAYYVCTLCNKHFSDAGTTEIDEESVKIPATGVHQNTELRNKKEATTTEKGYTGDVYCVDCGTLISLGDEIPVIETKGDNFEILNSEIGGGAPDAKIEMSVDELKAVLPEGDRQLLVAGDAVSLYLKVTSVSMSDTERLLFENKKRDYNIAKNICIDISLMKKINNGEAIEVTEPLNGEMKISLEIPENLKNTDSAVKRTYKLLRLHEGESEATEIFGAYDVSNGRLVFDTDRFSTYVLAYKDMPKDESNNQNKDDNNENTDKKFNDDSKSDVDETEDDVLDDEQGMRGTNVGSVDNAVGVNVDNKNANANIDANRKMDETEDDEQETNGTDGEHIDNVVENGFAKNAVSTEKIKWVYLLIAIGVVGIVVGCVKKRKR